MKLLSGVHVQLNDGDWLRQYWTNDAELREEARRETITLYRSLSRRRRDVLVLTLFRRSRAGR